MGNPTNYMGATMSWYARQMQSYSKNGTSISYTYDADGLRGSKTVNSAKTTYQYVDGQLLYEDRDGTDIYYYYDSYGTPTAIRYHKADGTAYTFYLATNQLGDVIGIYNASGNMVVKYEYDAWGRIISTTDANGGALNSLSQEWSDINPFRYRGYYYDAEIELYYLQSRYYDAEVGRFINSDSLVTTGDLLGFNTYAYCGNNPVNYSDPSGHFWKEAWNGIKNGAKKVGAWINNNVIQPMKKFFKPKSKKSNVKKNNKTIKGFAKTAMDAFSIEAGAGYGFGVSAEAGVIGFNASVKGNPIHIVVTPKDGESGLFYTFETNCSVDVLFFEIYSEYSERTNFFTHDTVYYKPPNYIGPKSAFSIGISLYFLMGFEIELSYDYGDIIEYIVE